MKAKRIAFQKVRRMQIIHLTKQDARAFAKALMKPAPPPSAHLIAMMQQSKAMFKDSKPLTGAAYDVLADLAYKTATSFPGIPGML